MKISGALVAILAHGIAWCPPPLSASPRHVLRAAPSEAPAGRLHRMVRPLMTAAAAVLLIAVGYQLGDGNGNHATMIMDQDGSLAEADLIDLYEMREVIDAWDLAEDAALERAFAASDEVWVDELLTDEGR